MNAPMDSTEPQYPTDERKEISSDYLYVVGFFAFAVFLLALTYSSYMYCKRSSSPAISTSGTPTYGEASDRHLLTLSTGGLDDDILVTFPTLLYSESTMRDKGDSTTDDATCSICLVNYKPEDVVRLLPECGHLFHVSCVDTWLKAHPTCPMCRKSPLVETLP